MLKNFPLFINSFFIAILVLTGNAIHAQNCDKIKKQKPPAELLQNRLIEIDRKSPVFNLLQCGLDSSDIRFLFGSPYKFLLVQSHTGNLKDVSYGDILENFDMFRAEVPYDSIKPAAISMYRLLYMKANPATWPEAKAILLDLDELNRALLPGIEAEMKMNDKELTYKEILEKLERKIPGGTSNNQNIAGKEITLPIQWEHRNLSLDSVKTMANQRNLSILLYLHDPRSLNCLDMERMVLSKTDVLSILNEQFVFVALDAADKTPLLNGRETIGSMNSKLMINLAGNNGIPLFVMLNAKGEVVRMIGYVLSKEVFINFLISDD